MDALTLQMAKNYTNKKVADHRNIPNLPSMAYLTGIAEVDVDFNSSTINFPSILDVFYNGNRKTISGSPPLSFANLNNNRYILFLDIETSVFSLKTESDNSNEVMVGTIRIISRQAWINGNYTVDGFSVGSNGRTVNETFQDVFYRYKKPVITSNKITFPVGLRLYKYDPSLGGPTHTIIDLIQDIEFTWVHNTSIVWDLESRTIVSVMYPERIRKGIVLFRNIDGKLVSGALKAQYDAESVTVSTNNKIYKDIGKLLSKTDITRAGVPNGSAVVGNEYWAFNASNDENTNYADCHRWLIDEDTYALTHIGSFSHNWGHVNSADYCAETDTFICGNGSESYVLSGKIFIFENASSFTTMSQVPLNDNAIIIDVGMTYGAKVNVVWGNDNDGRYDIAHIITNDNKDITRIQLGKGTVNLGLGNYITGKTDNQFNGSYKVLKTWNQLDGDDVVQGADYGDDGCVYVGLGHKGAWYSKQYLNADGTISAEISKSIYINSDGTENDGYSGSISLYKDKILIRVLKDGNQWVHVREK